MSDARERRVFRRLVAAVAGGSLVAGFLGLGRTAIALGAGAVAAVVLWITMRKSGHGLRDGAEWQRRIEREYRLDIEGQTISLFRNGRLETRFVWRDVVEVLSIRVEAFPGVRWKIVTAEGTFLLPGGGRNMRPLADEFIYKLPGYYEQRAVDVPPQPPELHTASLWRKDDPYPKRESLDDDDPSF